MLSVSAGEQRGKAVLGLWQARGKLVWFAVLHSPVSLHSHSKQPGTTASSSRKRLVAAAGAKHRRPGQCPPHHLKGRLNRSAGCWSGLKRSLSVPSQSPQWAGAGCQAAVLSHQLTSWAALTGVPKPHGAFLLGSSFLPHKPQSLK